MKNHQPDRALDLFDEFSSQANGTLYTIAFSACASLCNERAVQTGKKLLDRMPKTMFNNLIVVNSAIHMLMKFGDVEHAELLFSCINRPDTYTYGVMLNGYNINEKPRDCLKLFEQLKQHKIVCSEPIWVSLVGACSQIGMQSTCRRILDQIPLRAQETSEMKSSMIDMWVRVSYKFSSSDARFMSLPTGQSRRQ